MKITSSILNIPPYISTSWENIHAIFMDGNNLIIILNSKEKITIPNLEKEIINKIFNSHAKYLESKNKKSVKFKMPINFGKIDGIDSMESLMQHDPSQKNAEDLPKEILEKIASITKIMEVDEEMLPKAEPHCNCPHCQIARAVRGEQKEIIEEVTDQDLTFRTWDIKQTGKKLYQVTNPLDANEQYSVFLGNPIGCTCGKKNCDHIKAVLES